MPHLHDLGVIHCQMASVHLPLTVLAYRQHLVQIYDLKYEQCICLTVQNIWSKYLTPYFNIGTWVCKIFGLNTPPRTVIFHVCFVLYETSGPMIGLEIYAIKHLKCMDWNYLLNKVFTLMYEMLESKTVKPVFSNQSRKQVKMTFEGRWQLNTGQYTLKKNIQDLFIQYQPVLKLRGFRKKVLVPPT